MSWYVGKYVSTCDLCLRTKAHRHPLVGELHPLPIPDNPWDTVSMDFIVELQDSEGHDAVMVMVDSVTKRAHFMPTFTTITAARTARLFIQHVWKHHGLPHKVVSDRGPQFVAEFTQELYRMLGMLPLLTTHRETDKQNVLIKSWSSTSTSLSTNGRMTGRTSYRLRSFSTITMSTP